MAGAEQSLDEVADRLYGLSLDDFTPERDAAAKRLRQEGQREVAGAVSKLRKPNRVAWAINQVQRSERAAVTALIAAGAELRKAQRQLVEAGERGRLRSAAADEREQVGHLVELARRELASAGHAADAATEARLFSTLHAAATSDEVRDQLANGRLVRDHEISDLGLGGAAGVTVTPAGSGAGPQKPGTAKPQKPASAARSKRSEKPDRAQTARRRARERREQALRRRLEQARERRRRLDEKAKEAEGAAKAAQREAAKAEAAAARSRRSADDAAASAQAAAADVTEIEAELAGLGDQD
jgi:hypothetical protein